MARMVEDPRAKVLAIIGRLPGAEAVPVVEVHLRLEVGGKRFGWYMENHDGDGRLQINCKALPGRSHELVAENPAIYHIPKYVGHRGWAGVWVDVPEVDWNEVEQLLTTAYEMTTNPPEKKKSSAKSS